MAVAAFATLNPGAARADVNLGFTFTFTPPDPDATIHIDPISWHTSNSGVTTGGFDLFTDPSPQGLQLIDPFHTDPNQFTTFNLLGVYSAAGGGQSVFVGFTNGGAGAIGQTFEQVFSDLAYAGHQVTEAEAIFVLLRNANDPVTGDEFIAIRGYMDARADLNAALETPTQAGTPLTLVHFGVGTPFGEVTGEAFAPVPEPSAQLAFGAVIVGIAGYSQRRAAGRRDAPAPRPEISRMVLGRSV